MQKITLEEKFHLIKSYWSPKIIGELNGQYIKLAKFKGEFVWHTHEDEDEYFQVIKGCIVIHFRDHNIRLNEGECLIVPKGTEHKPEAIEEAHILLFKPKATAHTGSMEDELTVPVEKQDWI
ncbi:MAG: cupin domain-containing protein [Deferribacteres bacterium]|nr:cupin domain-containing protein [candidate division KSB1 bacterium]MCB9500295.1 cupin domain-containing protein [Deferribacteres bacterium]